MTDQPTAPQIAEVLDAADVVVSAWPDGAQNVLKGEERLARIAGHAQTERLEIATMPVRHDREAEVIAGALGAIEKGELNAAQLATLQGLLDRVRRLQ